MAFAELTYGANLGIGLFLAVLAGLLHRRSPDAAARGPLALFLLLVGANYVLDGAAGLILLADMPIALRAALLKAALVPVFLDPPMLLLFALSVAGRRPTRLLAAALFLPGVALLGLYAADPSPHMVGWRFNRLYLLELGIYYAVAYALLVGKYVQERRLLQRDRLGVLVTAFGVVVLPRLPLLLSDIGLASPGLLRANPNAATLLLAALAVVVAVATALVAVATPPANRAHVRRTWLSVLGLVSAVGAAWALLLVPPLWDSALSLLYPLRWFLFAAVLSVGVRRYDLLGLEDGARDRLRVAFGAALVALAFVEIAVVFGGLPGATLPVTVLSSAALVGLCAVAYAALRRAVPDATAAEAWGRLDVYRAHVELGTPPGELDDVRLRLGVTEREAASVREAARAPVLAPRVDLAEGALLSGRFEVREFLGAGAFGRAFLGWDRVRGERVVLKELMPAWRGDPEAAERFRREASVALRIDHPNLVGFRALERLPGGHVLVLAHVEGETLRSRLARGPLDDPAAERLARDLLAGLAALHAAGILHRDVKPDNVMLRPDGSAVLLDFGAAASVVGGTVLAGGRSHPGTPAYMSPEQARGGPLGPASDLYAAGVLLWEAVAGAPPPAGTPGPRWTPFLRRALDHDPARRFASAEAMRGAVPG